MLEVTLVPILEDNYAYIMQSGNDVAVLDVGEAKPVIVKLEEMGLTPTIIFNTHHHWDHVNGNTEIKKKYNATIIGPEKDKHRIPDIDKGLKDGDVLNFGDETIQITETPAHTSGHICFFFPQSKVLFSGDTLFAMGCGRLFEGTAEELFSAFDYFKTLPDDTKIYCGHEYTQSNGDFCLGIEPENTDLIERMEEVRLLRTQNTPTIPSTIELEKKTNVFLRAQNVETLKKYRQLKNKA